MGGTRYLGRSVAVLAVAVLLGACGDEGGADRTDAVTRPDAATARFCTLLAETGAEVEESYLGSPEHLAALEELVTAAPSDIAPALEEFRRYVRRSVDPAKPGSADAGTFPVAVTDAVARIMAYETDECAGGGPSRSTVVATGVPLGEGTTSTVVATTAALAAPPVIVDGVPQVKASPGSGSVGDRIHVEGDGFDDGNWKAAGNPLWIVAQVGGCSMYAEAQHTITVTAAGRLTGDFVIPATGTCRMSDTGDQPVRPGRYTIAFQCTACSVGEFEVTPG
ncbi:MAG: hypothetical protein ACR2MO_07495 [Acidimicrobiales bacterium]